MIHEGGVEETTPGSGRPRAGAVALLAAVFSVAPAAAQVRFEAGPSPAVVTAVAPARVEVGEVVDVVVRLRLNERVGKGGVLLVDFGKEWFTHPFPLIKPVQTSDPAAPHYLWARSGEARFELSWSHVGVTGKSERFRHLLRAVVATGELRAGDEIEAGFSRTSAPTVAGASEIAVAVDATGKGGFRRVVPSARVDVASAAPAHLAVVAPSQAVAGSRVETQVTVFDRFYNPAAGVTGRVEVVGLGPQPLRATLRAEDGGRAVLVWRPRGEGLRWIQAHAYLEQGPDQPADHLVVAGGPVRVLAKAPATSVYWGDLHSHSDLSKDGEGSGDFEFAREVTRLDFFASTEHHSDDGWVSGRPPGPGLTEAEWDAVKAKVRDFYEPGRFVTLLAYECSLGAGHHNVFFRGLQGVPCPPEASLQVEELWASLRAGEAFTIPHHLGIEWGRQTPSGRAELEVVREGDAFAGGPALDWSGPHDRRLRPALEIYSAHGQSELFDPTDPLAYGQVHFTPARSTPGPHYARDAWASELEMAVVAASDDHSARPGLSHFGLTAVRAPELTREAIFDALLAGRSYGTTGERILLDLSVAGVTMGRVGQARGALRGAVSVAAPSLIEKVEVYAWDSSAGEWRVAARWEHPGQALEATFEDDLEAGRRVYYVRVDLEVPTGRRPARAWSSPVWIDADAGG